jgi:hypothetical protein
MISHRHALIVGALLGALSLPPGTGAAVAAPSPIPTLTSPATAASPIPAGDKVTAATADEGGYHLFAASAGGGWRRRRWPRSSPAATPESAGPASTA